LLVDSLAKHNPKARRANGVNALDLRAPAIEKNSAPQFLRVLVVPLSIQDYFVFLFDFESRMSESLREIAIVG
jgi:hypothetical protein